VFVFVFVLFFALTGRLLRACPWEKGWASQLDRVAAPRLVP
jgi:hypothetical protein